MGVIQAPRLRKGHRNERPQKRKIFSFCHQQQDRKTLSKTLPRTPAMSLHKQPPPRPANSQNILVQATESAWRVIPRLFLSPPSPPPPPRHPQAPLSLPRAHSSGLGQFQCLSYQSCDPDQICCSSGSLISPLLSLPAHAQGSLPELGGGDLRAPELTETPSRHRKSSIWPLHMVSAHREPTRPSGGTFQVEETMT